MHDRLLTRQLLQIALQAWLARLVTPLSHSLRTAMFIEVCAVLHLCLAVQRR
jgi:hypothetical protein